MFTMNSNSEKKVLLLISQDVELEKSFRTVYENSCFDIMSVPSGKKALEVISEIRPSIMLSEFNTEDWDDRMLITTFMNSRSLVAYQNIPFIVLSDEEQKKRYSSDYIQMGIRGWYTKPFGAHEMKDVIDNILITHGLIEKTLELKQEVKRSKYRYRDLLENANDFIFTLDIDGSFVYLNNRFAPLTGYDKDSWIGSPFGDLIYQPDREDALDYYKMTHQGRARIFEARVICRTDSNPPYLSFNITPIFEKGAIVGSIGIARDVTESKKMEKEILDLKNFNESIIQSMEAGLLTTNLKGIITSLNSGGEKILEWKNSEIIGRSLTEILKPSEAKYLLSSPPPPGALPYSREMQLTVKSGRKISVGFTTTTRIDNQGNKVGSLV